MYVFGHTRHNFIQYKTQPIGQKITVLKLCWTLHRAIDGDDLIPLDCKMRWMHKSDSQDNIVVYVGKKVITCDAPDPTFRVPP